MSTVNGGWRGPNIVKDGLVLYLDAGSPTSFPLINRSTTWRDISGNANNGVLTNGPTFSSANGGNIVFDGVDDWVNLGAFQTLVNNFTLTLWCRITSAVGANILGFYNISSPFNGWGLGYAQSAAGLNFWDGSAWRVPNITVTDSIWRQITVVISPTYLLSFYINGIFSTSIQGSTISTFTGNKSIGARNDSLGPMTGNISQLQIYNRALSASEVLQNFNATRARFGI
jgi:hypothetical protein